jgi:putative membrane protein
MFGFDDDWGPDMMDGRDRGGMMDGYNRSGMMDDGGAWVLMILGFVLVLALIGLAIFWVTRATGAPTAASPAPGSPTPPPPSRPSPREVLDVRLARGEVTPEEYTATRELLDR